MNDYNVSRVNAYSHPVQSGSDPRNVNSVGVSGAGETGGSSAESRGVTMTQVGQFKMPSVGSNKNVLVASERPATLSVVDEASDALTNFINGLKQTDDENAAVNKSLLWHPRNVEKDKKKEEVADAEIDARKVLGEVETVGNKCANASSQADMQAQVAIRKNAEENAERTANGQSKGLQGLEIGLKVLGTVASVRENFIGESEHKKKAIYEGVNLFTELGGDIAHIFKTSKDVDDNVVRARQDEAFNAINQHVTRSSKSLIKSFIAMAEDARKAAAEIQRMQHEAESQIHISSN